MLCPSNPAKTSETYWELLSGDAIGAALCTPIDMTGSGPVTLPDGSVVNNPCREIIDGPLAPDREFVDIRGMSHSIAGYRGTKVVVTAFSPT